MNPYPADIDFSRTLQEVGENFKDGEEVDLVGRVMSIRGQGALLFLIFMMEQELFKEF